MSNSYLVKCPQFGCGWTGVLSSASCDSDSWSGFEPTVTLVAFECPACNQEWRTRVVAGKVKQSMPVAQWDDADPIALEWPPAEIGAGD